MRETEGDRFAAERLLQTPGFLSAAELDAVVSDLQRRWPAERGTLTEAEARARLEAAEGNVLDALENP